ncbi:MAG: hypothetical protein ACK587_08135 [Cyanobacteriota bacterium]
MIMFGRWLTLSGLVIEDVDDEGDEGPSAYLSDSVGDRWIEAEDGTMLPRVNMLHIIPMEDPDEDKNITYTHCATVECWCNPTFADCSDNPSLEGKIIKHNPMTSASQGWVIIGERSSE